MVEQGSERFLEVHVWGKSLHDMSESFNMTMTRGARRVYTDKQAEVVAHTKRMVPVVEVEGLSEELQHLLLTESDYPDRGEDMPIIVQASVEMGFADTGYRYGEGAAAVFLDEENNGCVIVLCFEVKAP